MGKHFSEFACFAEEYDATRTTVYGHKSNRNTEVYEKKLIVFKNANAKKNYSYATRYIKDATETYTHTHKRIGRGQSEASSMAFGPGNRS
jgi:hypothetical protein